MMKRLFNIITILCLFTVLSINYGPNLVSDGSETSIVSDDLGTQLYSDEIDQSESTDDGFQPYDRSNRSYADEPIHPKVEKLLFIRTR
ncbi:MULTISPECIES: hypothetical protein [Bacillaceae]|uniref:Secreted protein n=1 Tax=Gottfriedia luciferensis TaxID=178774 RepID=A0ABX2ZVK2_9BACI|nr:MULTISPECIES: hypothetical protein [Bacillaceae]ODG92459.1 hypothetical protein BED47_19835 [Gottfriedia luciferensis]SFD49980.1 hypothetical protein SAMN02799633_03979 [Bacillus sp. UNCCL81]